MTIPDEEFYKSVLQSRLKPKRYEHSLNVADSSEKLARIFGADPQKAYTAGLLHDIFKGAEHDEVFELFKRYGYVPDEITVAQKKLWHAVAGSLYIKNEYHMPDDIVTAVRYHTTGRRGMTLLERVIFIADFVSADRDYPGVDKIREKAEKSLESAMLEGLQFTIIELAQETRPVHPDSLDCYNELILSGIE